MSIDPKDIPAQRAAGWPDYHPETYCHRCGRRNIESWFSPEWVELTGSHAGILCPVCFADEDPEDTWVLTRFTAWDDLRVAVEAAREVLTSLMWDPSRHHELGSMRVCNTCGKAWPCEVARLRDALAACSL